MNACVCVDYLSHEWSPPDLIHTQREIRGQMAQLHLSVILASPSPAPNKVKLELQRLLRFQNALWRQMARTCTSRLGQHNRRIPPSSVNWQKESDITWLYGPLYTLDQPASAPSSCSSQHSGLKPVLKKAIKLPAHDFRLPTWSDQPFEQTNYRPWSKTTSESGTSSTTSTITSPGVRFSHNIIQVEYLPESPVREFFAEQHDGPLGIAYVDSSWDSDTECDSNTNEDDEALEDGVLWSLVADAGSCVQRYAETCLSRLARYLVQPQPGRVTPTTAQVAPCLKNQTQRHTSKELPALLFSAATSTASMAAAWVAYQSLLPFAWFVDHPSFRSSPDKRSPWISALDQPPAPPPNPSQSMHGDIRSLK